MNRPIRTHGERRAKGFGFDFPSDGNGHHFPAVFFLQSQRFFKRVIVSLTGNETQILILDPGFGFIDDKAGCRIRYRSDATDNFH